MRQPVFTYNRSGD